ncbi:MAG: gluconolactonase [Acidimicrobiaceae bacterium]|nr:gluconolactonase [Acidimicrobiaceae bacterium]
MTVIKIPARFEQLDPRFACAGDAWWEHHFDDGRWTEGPVYVPAGRYLIFGDIPNDRSLRWDAATNTVGPYEHDTNYANGRTLDLHGRVVTCEQGARRVVRVEHDGSITVLADRFEGGRLNSPNDVVVTSDGAVWFTDPTYGIKSPYEGHASESELSGNHVYRIAPNGTIAQMTSDYVQPNGIAFSPDETSLFVVDSAQAHIRRSSVGDAGLTDDTVAIRADQGTFDGIRFDTRGTIWAAAVDGVRNYATDGTLLGKIHLPEEASNLTFGGPKRNQLFVTATRSLYSIMLNISGAAPRAA